VVDVEDVDGTGVFLDPVDDPVGAPPGSVTARQWAVIVALVPALFKRAAHG
jgi:hypothetical protein